MKTPETDAEFKASRKLHATDRINKLKLLSAHFERETARLREQNERLVSIVRDWISVHENHPECDEQGCMICESRRILASPQPTGEKPL